MATFREAAQSLGASQIRDTRFWSDTSGTANNVGTAFTVPADSWGSDGFTLFIEVYTNYSNTNITGQVWGLGTTATQNYNSPAVVAGSAVPSSATIRWPGNTRWVIKVEPDYYSPGNHRVLALSTDYAGTERVSEFTSTQALNPSVAMSLTAGNTSTGAYPRQLTGNATYAAFIPSAVSDDEAAAFLYYEDMTIGTPAAFSTTPATASASMNGATFSFTPTVVIDNAVSATTATAAASMGAARGRAVTVETRRVLGAATYRTNTANPVTSASLNRNASGNSYFVKVPHADLYSNDETVRALYLAVGSAGAYFQNDTGTLRVNKATLSGGTFTVGAQLLSVGISGSTEGQVWNVPLAQGDQWINIQVSGSEYVYVDNPSVDHGPPTGNLSAFYADVVLPDVTEIHAAPAEVSAEMLNATGQVTAGVSFGATVATASSEMLRGYVPDANAKADLMTASARMGAAWFRSGRRVAVEALEGTAEALSGLSVVADRNIIVEAATAVSSSGWIVNPLEVNEDVTDPYWNRVMRRSTDGHIPAIPFEWFRFNERSGSTVRLTDPRTGLKVDAGAGVLDGTFTWGHPAPNGKRALRVENAGMSVARDEAFSNMSAGASLEFTVKVDPGHRGRMDIANGVMNPVSTPGTYAHSHVSVRDGRLFATAGGSASRTGGGKGGTSFRRIDDGRWHHIVITPRAGDYRTNDRGENIPLEMYIDGVLERSFLTDENRPNVYVAPDPRSFARPDHYFGHDTDYPFSGEILEVVYRRSSLRNHEVMDLYLDMFGYKAVRAGLVGAAVAAMGDAKVESNMKRMLVLDFQDPPVGNMWTHVKTDRFGALVNSREPIRYTEMMLHGKDGEYDIGNYRMTWQSVSGSVPGDAHYEMLQSQGVDLSNFGNSYTYRDEKTGLRRLIDVHKDVNLDDFDVIYVQSYPNPALNTQAEVERYEAFFESLNKALVDGKKLWITDPYLAADLGWVSKVDEVPVLRNNGNDVRGHDVAPFPELTGITQQPALRPADGSMPVLPKGIPEGSKFGLWNLWRWDMHHNNGYRVVNEIEGMTDLPSWEVDELFVRDRETMIPNGNEWWNRGYRLENRSGEDFAWQRERDDAPGGKWEMVKPSTGLGLKAGDEFYDYTWFESGFDWFYNLGSANDSRGQRALLNRAQSTWAVPMGHLKVGVPVTTFRSTVHDDFGREVPNPYRNHIRNAVVRPGDRLPDGRKVMGYAVMEFGMRPDNWFLSGQGIEKQLTFPANVMADLNTNFFKTPVLAEHETDRSVEWDHTFFGRMSYSGGGVLKMTSWSVAYRPQTWVKGGSQGTGTDMQATFKANDVELPIAERISNIHPVEVVPHQNWISRGLSWLMTVDEVENEYANAIAEAATATGRMTKVQVDTEFDRVVEVGAAQAYGTIVAPEEAAVKDTTVFAPAATAGAKMNGLVGGYRAEAAQAFASMPENVSRPLDIEEVLFFTVTMSQKTINLRMEEN